jgi:WD40 repeat protein
MRPAAQNRVFISYSRSPKGRDYAAWLRRRLENEHPEIEIFQDVISLHSGKDWWLQITKAIDNVAYMVLVATPEAMDSDAVRKEWGYARAKGVCVLPVQASDNLDFGRLPRWMKTKHFADLKIEQQWERFIEDLHRPCEAPRVPSMADDLPRDFVARPAEFGQLVDHLLDEAREKRDPTPISAALIGAGGFGKTTLAKAVCHDNRIQEVFDDGVLWVTLGKKVENLVGKVAELVTVLSGEPTSFISIEGVTAKLKELLADRDILMVIDDVWDAAHIKPFLEGGRYCARLITTRNLETLPSSCRSVKVDSMLPGEAVELLVNGLPEGCWPEAAALATRVGEWPLLLGIMNGILRERVEKMHQPFSEAIAYANKALDKRGLTAFDPANTEARDRAVKLTVDVSLERFTPDQRERFEELSIFQEGVEIPLETVARLWQATAGLDEFDAEELCGQLYSRSLLQKLDLASRELLLHGVMRTYLQAELAKRIDPRVVHGKLIEAWGDPHRLTEAYAWRWFAYHNVAAARLTELRELLMSPAWLQEKLAATDLTSVIADFDYLYLPNDKILSLVLCAIRLSAHVIDIDPRQFASQLGGRLLPWERLPAIHQFNSELAKNAPKPSLRLFHPALNFPGSGQLRTLSGHESIVYGVAITSDGRRAISGSIDQTLRLWDLKSGQLLRTGYGHEGSIFAVAITPDDRKVISGSSDGTIRIWDIDGEEPTQVIQCDSLVNGLAVTSDGLRIVSAHGEQRSWTQGATHSGTGNNVIVWDLATRQIVTTLKGHKHSVSGVALTADDKLAVSSGADTTVRVWDLEKGCQLHVLEGHFSEDPLRSLLANDPIGVITSVAVSRDGRYAVSASDDQTLKVWDIDAGKELRTLKGHTGWVLGVAIAESENGRFAVSASADQTVKVWDLETGQERRTLCGHCSQVNRVAVTPDGRFAVSASTDANLAVWDLQSEREDSDFEALTITESHSSQVSGFAVISSHETNATPIVISSSWDQTIGFWDVATGRKVGGLECQDKVDGIAYMPDTRQLFAASGPYLQREDMETGTILPPLNDPESLWALKCVAAAACANPDDNRRYVVTGSSDKKSRVWDVDTGQKVRELIGHEGMVTAVAVTPDGRYAVSGSEDCTLRVWRLADGKEICNRHPRISFVKCVAIAPDGRVAVSSFGDGTLTVWDTDSWSERWSVEGHRHAVTGVAVSPNGRWVLSAGWDNMARLWDLETGQHLATFTCDGAANSCAFVDDFRIVVGDSGGRVYFLEFEEPAVSR